MLTIRRRGERADRSDALLVLPFELRQKSRFLATTESGEEAGVVLERGTLLRDGDFLVADDGRSVRVAAAPEHLCEVRCADPMQLARCAFHLGNRHTPVELGEGWLRFAADDVLVGMVGGLGATVQRITAPFQPEAGAYAGPHAHAAGEPTHRGIIHDMAQRVRATGQTP